MCEWRQNDYSRVRNLVLQTKVSDAHVCARTHNAHLFNRVIAGFDGAEGTLSKLHVTPLATCLCART